MFVSRLQAKNWRNFRQVDVPLRERQFIVGANATGKSNLLDIFRFLRDIAKSEGGGLQSAVRSRGGVAKIRSLAARSDPEISITVELAASADAPVLWRYSIGIRQEDSGHRRPYLTHEKVWRASELILNRPDEADQKDKPRLTQTFLEQINANEPFRELAGFFEAATYLHLVPQLLKNADLIQGRVLEDDPFGQGFLERLAHADSRTVKSRFKHIEKALNIAVPQLEQLRFERDKASGHPHLQALYSHWRHNAGWQREDQFSDGTLRLIGLLWSLLESDSLLLLEEPELSLNAGIVSKLAPLFSKLQRLKKYQILVSTHSDALLTDKGIDGREVMVLSPAAGGTEVRLAADIVEVRALLEGGLTVGEAVRNRTAPANAEQLVLIP